MTDIHTGSQDVCNPESSECPDQRNLPPLCLKQVFPKYSKQFSHFRVLERVTDLFIRFLGMKGSMRMGPTGFRTFIRWVSGGSVLCVALVPLTQLMDSLQCYLGPQLYEQDEVGAHGCPHSKQRC